MITYFLFGETASQEYQDGGAMGVKTRDGDVFLYNDQAETPAELLSAFEGWNGFSEITKEDYNLLSIHFEHGE